ncbi:MAG: hypothetical protein V4751_11000 [Pseudomonadota bacterium]
MKPVLKNLRTTLLACTSLLAATLYSSATLAQTTAPATIPSSFLGTYNLTYSSAQAGSPLTNGTAVSVVIGPGGALCLAGINLSNPVLHNGNPHEATWSYAAADIAISVSSLVNGFNEINVSKASTIGTSSSKFYGQLSGSKVSTSTTGCSATPAPTTPDPAKVQQLFDLAQQKLAQYFSPTGASATQVNGDYTYRFYSATNVYLAISKGEIYVMGGQFGNQPVKQGPLEAILSELAKMPVTIPEVPSGNSTLVITGRVGTNGFNVDIGAITIDNLPMPASGDIDDVRKAVEDQYKNSGITGTIAVTLISSSSSKIVFNIKFNGAITQSGFTLTQNYDITYTYTKK